jgi:prevent-host-death family protein
MGNVLLMVVSVFVTILDVAPVFANGGWSWAGPLRALGQLSSAARPECNLRVVSVEKLEL